MVIIFTITGLNVLCYVKTVYWLLYKFCLWLCYIHNLFVFGLHFMMGINKSAKDKVKTFLRYMYYTRKRY